MGRAGSAHAERVAIPLRCPECAGRMCSVRCGAPLRALLRRARHCCRDCGFAQGVDGFKRSLLTA